MPNDEIKSNLDDLILSSKSMGSGGIPFPSYGSGWGAIQGFQSEAAWSSWLDATDGYGVNNVLKYQRLLGDLSRNSLMVAAIRFLGDSLLEAPVQVKEKEGGLSGKKGESEIVADHKLPTLWNRPNDFYDGTVLKKGVAFSLVLASNAYVIKNFNDIGAGAAWPIELWWEPHWTIRPVWPVNGSQFISHYEINRQGQWYALPIENVIHIRDGISPYNQRLGFDGNPSISPELYADVEAANYYASLMGGAGVPQFMVGIDKDMKMDQSKTEALQKFIVRKTTGDQKGQPFVIGGAKAYKLGISPKDLDLSESRFSAEDRFCAVQGVPAVVLELGSGRAHSIYNNVQAAMERAWRSYVCPKLTMIEGALNHSLLPDFEEKDKGRYVEHDLSQIQALQEDQDQKADRLGKLYQTYHIITRGEARSGMGYGESIEGDKEVDNVFEMPSGLQLLKPGEVAAPQPDMGFGGGGDFGFDEFGEPIDEYSDTPLLATAKAFLKGGPGSGPNPGNKHKTKHEQSPVVQNIRTQLTKGRNIDFTRKLNKLGLEGAVKWANEHIELMRSLGYGRIVEGPYEKKSLEFNQSILDLLPNGFLNPEASWQNFPDEMHSLNIPRTSMPQVLSSHRGAMVQFLRGRGITHTKEEVLPTSLTPTQAEYRPDKVETAKTHEGPDRPILVSSDNYVVDGHHQWMASIDTPDELISIIRLDSTILPLLLEVARFPSSGVTDEDDKRKFWSKAMPNGKQSVTSKDVTDTIAFLKKHRYAQATAMMQAKPIGDNGRAKPGG